MSTDQQLFEAALLGTARRPLTPALDEAALLGSLAVSSVQRLAGAMPLTPALAVAAPCPPEEQPYLSNKAAGVIVRLLATNQQLLLTEWLDHAAQRGLLVPPELLAALCETAVRQPALRDILPRCGGHRLAWLAAQNPAWNWAGQPSADWDTGTPAERLTLLQQLRRTDPAAARDRLAATWKTLPAQERAGLIAALSTGLTLNDEALLESVLDDRSIAVRRAAADLLAHLPTSQLAQRMLARVGHRLTIERRGLLRKRAIEVQLLDACDAGLQRDGVECGKSQSGDRSRWTAAAIAAVPLTHWTNALGLTPADLTAAAQEGDWAELLLNAWSIATVRQQRHDWANTLLAVDGLAVRFPGLLALLTKPEREAHVLQALQQQPPAITLLPACPGPWSHDFALRALSLALRPRQVAMTYWWELEGVLKACLTRLPFDIAATLPPDLPPPLATWAEQLRLRQEMHELLDLEQGART